MRARKFSLRFAANMQMPDESIITSLTIIRYPKRYIFFALLAMAIHRFPLLLNKKIHFWKLLGCGRGGGFSKKPDWQQWAILVVREKQDMPDTQTGMLKMLYGSFIAGWYKCWKCETHSFLLEPVSGHGAWDRKPAFGILPASIEHEGRIAVLTRATIRFNKLKRFWAHVEDTSALVSKAPGLEYSVSIGEIPFVKQATFSIWNSMEDMKAFAYATRHVDIVQKTRSEKWYGEEMFVRFRVLAIYKDLK
ncbi:MAG: spheroidene monooxygenase [Chitinophagaceae bacterium]|nr:spheroidene monooxygenase [Chitinophagaceae bacterium]